MALESIGGKNSISYSDLIKQPVNREARATQIKDTSTDIAKEVTPALSDSTRNTEPAYPNEPETGEADGKTARRIKDAIDQVNKKMKPTKTKCEFSYHEETKRVSIKVIDEETEEVIREIPPEETLEMLTKMWELAGLLVDEKR